MASPEPQNAETLFVWKAKHRDIISTFWVLFYLNQKEKKQKLVSAWIHVSLNPRAWARTQRASARGHQESSITEERNRAGSEMNNLHLALRQGFQQETLFPLP